MSRNNCVAVFCAASDSVSQLYFDAAREVGAMLGRIGVSLVYGGTCMGLMEATAKSAKDAGARIVGVVPDIIVKRNRVSTLLDEQIPCTNLSDRKDIMLEKSDILVALPGGVGTLDEIFHVVASAKIGYHSKRVVLYNVNGFWDGLSAVLHQFSESGFLRGNIEACLVVANSIGELEYFVKEAVNE